jgi:hypothetical protein
VQQRTLVTQLLKRARFHLAWAPDDEHLFLHAGVTLDILSDLEIDPTRGARAIARGLEDHFQRTVGTWQPPEPLEIPHVHVPGNSARGEGSGMLYHRAAKERSDNRKFDPRRLPLGVTQVIGHVRDKKCRDLLGDWCESEPSEDGPIRHLVTDGTNVQYARGMSAHDPSIATVIYLDGGMNHVKDLDRYELLEITEGDPPRPRAPSPKRSA